jgi:hypothetical protein
MRRSGLPRASLRVVVVLALFLATAIQLGPAVRPAAAEPPFECEPKWADQEFKVYLNDEWVKYKCAFGSNFKWWWVISGVGSDEEREDWERYVGPSVYQALLQSGIGAVGGPGMFIGAYELRTPSGIPMPRILAVRLLVKYSSGGVWHTCSDTGWKVSPRATSRWEYWLEYGPLYGKPKCGDHTYRVSAAGQFRSVSTGQWVTHSWVQPGDISLHTPLQRRPARRRA